ncbi:amidohydrolase family protein [Alicyclobacillus fastidiosus]|uniref:Amidohydrolase family protein n=1 Tax=Alicyclobacillus fastidiosus TaxID=392011 RepID=A0ABV5ACW4_9BACL|nr:amidohydrolase family protein [Alicyclobacillus fastidiosus]WEH11265.1 amidohydrolase family protein [Alicyclobacillus fastidiosus]
MFDVHSHFVPRRVLEWLELNQARVPMTLDERVPGKDPFLTVNDKWSFELKRTFFDPAAYLAEQSAAGIKHTLVSPIPQLFLYDFSADITTAVSELYNGELAAWVQSHDERLSGLGTIPLNAPEQAAQTLETALDLGLKGVIIGPGHQGIPLSDERFRPVWQKADDAGAIVFIHPLLNDDPRIQRLMMPNLIGVPWETTICALDLILGGVLDQYPNVKVLLAHGGGFLPYQVGRLTQGYSVWPAVRNTIQESPAEYLRRFWYDSVLWDERSLKYLQSVVGLERVLPGSDYPFDLRVWPPMLENEDAVQAFLNI